MTPAKTTAGCARLFQVEALRDGRLGGAERKTFERHVAVCPVCARETEALDALAAAARAGVEDADELRIWRERTRLLAAFDQGLVSTRKPRRWLLLPATAVALLAAVIVFARVRPVAEPLPRAHASIRADAGSVWSRRPGGGEREEVALSRGRLRIHVDHAAGERPLLVVLPDGELVDVGTTFTVSADGEHTTRVAVEDGRVVLRLRGKPAVDIGPGSVWPREAPAAAPGRERDPDRSPAARIARPTRIRALHPPESPDPLVEFRAASAALRAGDNRQAASAFARFLTEHARDPMAEDASYLRIIALQRLGAAPDMKRAVEDYLQRFPTGFRRAEVARLANQTRSPE